MAKPRRERRTGIQRRKGDRAASGLARDARDKPEIVIGLVAAVGTPLDIVQRRLSARLKTLGYSSDPIRLSDFIERFELGVPYRGNDEAKRIDSLMTRGDKARTQTTRDDILALAAIADIRVRRRTAATPLPAHAFILRQLKRPEEVHLLRRTYGEGFVLVGVYCPRTEREKNLRNQAVSGKEIAALIERDEQEDILGGQALRKTFHLADLFVEVAQDPTRGEDEIDRAVDSLFGVGFRTPSKSEIGMFHAFGASLRSAQLGRQVGAAILSASGELITVGANEVPRAGGGQYWEGDPRDARDHRYERDSTNEAQEEIVREILERTSLEWDSATSKRRRELVADLMRRLKSSRVMSLTEFGRAVHAEAEAIVSAARSGVSTRGGSLFCTTFPCHVCAKHIVAAGITTVTYIEPYPKSQALALHSDSVSIEEPEEGKVLFRPFVGVAPRLFPRLFSMTAADGTEIPRKDEVGMPIADRAALRLRMAYFSALQNEELAAQELENLTINRSSP